MATTNVGRFMTEHGISTLTELRRRSIADPAWFWDATVRFLGIRFTEPYTDVLDVSRGIEWATWFTGGTLNIADVCVDRWAEEAPDRVAVVWEGEDGEVRQWTYADLQRESDALAFALAAQGVGEGDAVGVYLPMVPETVATVMGIAKVGAVFLPLFSGYAADAIVTRLEDAEAKVLVTADGFYRRGKPVDMWRVADEAASQVASVHTVFVVPRMGTDIESGGGRNVVWPEPLGDARYPTRMVDSEHTLFIAYTSGTTGRPKGSVHVHGGWTVKVAEEGAFQTDVRAGDTLFWVTDIGWIMGPWEMTAGLAAGATLALYEGAPDHPGPDRLWEYVERHRVNILGISPTLIRSLMPHGDEPVRAHDLSSLRCLASTGEPWNEDPWRWYFEVVGGGRCPVINISGGTEVGACFLSPHPVEPLKPMSLGGPSLGMAVDVFDDAGRPVRGEVGELVCTKPWPGMTRGLFRDPERYLDTYWSMYPGVWRHGDWASIDVDGDWFLHGRSDDTIKVAGKRLGPAEVESALVSHPNVVEAAAVGLPDERKGEQLWAYVVVAAGTAPGDDLRNELTDLVATHLGKSFRPAGIRFVRALPKTRSAKVVRRVVRAVATGTDPGDLSTLEDPTALDALREAT
jgi:acetyl-CoA synthetase